MSDTELFWLRVGIADDTYAESQAQSLAAVVDRDLRLRKAIAGDREVLSDPESDILYRAHCAYTYRRVGTMPSVCPKRAKQTRDPIARRDRTIARARYVWARDRKIALDTAAQMWAASKDRTAVASIAKDTGVSRNQARNWLRATAIGLRRYWNI